MEINATHQKPEAVKNKNKGKEHIQDSYCYINKSLTTCATSASSGHNRLFLGL